MSELVTFLREHAPDGLISWCTQCTSAELFATSLAAVEELALEHGLLPARYQRNRSMITTAEQLLLFRSRVSVIGCGGLGGYIIEELARLGVGRITAIDPDIFEEHNLNRQILSTPATLGQSKVSAAFDRVAAINPAVTVTPVRASYCSANGRELLQGSHAVVDALDSISTRLELAESCTALNIPLVHGAIGGWYGHVATQLPGDTSIQRIYRNWDSGKGIEQQLGNPSFTPAVVASLQCAEICKILLGRGELLRNRQLTIDLLTMEIVEIPLDSD